MTTVTTDNTTVHACAAKVYEDENGREIFSIAQRSLCPVEGAALIQVSRVTCSRCLVSVDRGLEDGSLVVDEFGRLVLPVKGFLPQPRDENRYSVLQVGAQANELKWVLPTSQPIPRLKATTFSSKRNAIHPKGSSRR